MGKEPEKKIKSHFELLDKDGNGALNVDELAILLEDMGHTKAQAVQDAQVIIRESDADGSGEIEFEEFAQIWQRKLLSVNESYIHAVFTVLDENGDGNIDSAELAKVLDMQSNEDKSEINA